MADWPLECYQDTLWLQEDVNRQSALVLPQGLIQLLSSPILFSIFSNDFDFTPAQVSRLSRAEFNKLTQ